MPGHLATVALATIAAAAPAHSARAYIPVERHAAAASSFAHPSPAQSAPSRPSAPRRPKRRPVAHPATGDPAVTIADFDVTAPSTTIHVGDTITWTNDGPSAHTATATNGSFDTGTLSKGQSASHTFTQAGTYTYICKIHPFMHGTIVVLAAAASSPQTTTTSSAPATTTPATTTPATTTPTSPRGAPAAASSSATTTTAQAATAKPSLPVTGIDVLSAIAVGAIFLAAGLALRRAVWV